MFGLGIDLYDAFKGIILLVVTSGFVYAILEQFDSSKLCNYARLVQAVVLFLLGFLFDSAFSVVLSTILLVIGFGDYVAFTNNQLAFLDPNLG